MNNYDQDDILNTEIYEESPIADESPKWKGQPDGDLLIPDDVDITAMWKEQDGGNGEAYILTKGSLIGYVRRIAGKGTRKISGKRPEIESSDDNNVLGRLIQDHGGTKADWYKAKGNGYADDNNQSYPVELHWFCRDGLGAVDLKIKDWEHYIIERAPGQPPMGSGIRATSQYVLMEDGIYDTKTGNMITDGNLLKVSRECRELLLEWKDAEFCKYFGSKEVESLLSTEEHRMLASVWIMERGDELFGILDTFVYG